MDLRNLPATFTSTFVWCAFGSQTQSAPSPALGGASTWAHGPLRAISHHR